MVRDDCRPVVTLLSRGENRKLATWEPVASIRMRRGSARVKGFGCRPVVTYPAVLGAGVRKPPRKEPAGNRCAVCRLWGFGCAEIHVKFALPRPTQLARSTERLFEHLAMNLVYLVMLHVNASSRSVPGLATDHDVAHCA